MYGVRGTLARCEFVSNALVTRTKPTSFSVLDLGMFLRVLATVEQVHENDYTDFHFIIAGSFIKFESKKFKTKLTMCNDEVISKWVSQKVKAEMVPVFEFTSTSDMIKRINSHSFIFQNPQDLRVYLETREDMENNTLYSTLGNKDNSLNNEMTLKFGIVTSGQIPEGRNLVLDLERMNIFNALPTNEIKFSLMNLNVLVSKATIAGKGDSFFNATIYSTILKA